MASGFTYYGYRYLDTQLGRWLSRDPIGERGGANLFGFIENNSVNRADLLGLQSEGNKTSSPADDEYQDIDYSCACYCAEDIKFIANGYNPKTKRIEQLSSDRGHVGHKFQTQFIMSHAMVRKGAGVPCQIEWWEYTDDPYLKDMKKNTWKELTSHPEAANTFNTPIPLYGPSYLDEDSPGLDPKTRQNGTGERTLHIRIKLKSGPGCPCEKPEVVRELTQYLKWSNGKMSDKDSFLSHFGENVPPHK